MKKVRMIIEKTTTHSIERAFFDSAAERLIARDKDMIANVAHDLATEENIIDGSYEIEDLEVIE